MHYVNQLEVKKIKDKNGICLKVYIPKYIEEQLEILLENRLTNFKNKYITHVTKYPSTKHYNTDVLTKEELVNTLLEHKVITHIGHDVNGVYWLLEINIRPKKCIKMLMELDQYFSNKPLVKVVIKKEYPTLKLSDLNIQTSMFEVYHNAHFE